VLTIAVPIFIVLGVSPLFPAMRFADKVFLANMMPASGRPVCNVGKDGITAFERLDGSLTKKEVIHKGMAVVSPQA
jgi:hypothetical protein